MSARTGDSVKTVVSKSFTANTRIELELGGANRHQSSVGNISGLASCQVWESGSGHCGESSKHLRKAPAKIQGWNTQCEHPERKSLRGSGNTIPQENGMSAAFKRPDTVVPTAAQSRARTPGTSSTGHETTKALLV